MKVTTRESEALLIVKCYADEEIRGSSFGVSEDNRKRMELIALGENPKPDDVDRIIGNRATWPDCQACGQSVEKVVVFDSEEFDVCQSCLESAIQKIKGE